MTIQLFNEEEDISLKEYSEDPNYEDYAGIVLDKDKNQFKVITGKFTDKKDFYNKMADRGLILRKCFEIRVYNWIKENARTTLDAYLMLSTAFSKWKGNNMLSPYYNKLLKDIPELNREGQKGNPNTRGKKEEAVLEEDEQDTSYEDFVKKLFFNVPLAKEYLNALAIEDPDKSAMALIKAGEANKEIYLSDIPHSTHTSLTYGLNKEIERRKNLEKYIHTHGKIDPKTLEYRNTQYNKLNASKYNIRITPAIGKIEEVMVLPHSPTAKLKKVQWAIPEKADTTLSVDVPQVQLFNYEDGTSVLSCLNNPYLLKTICDVYKDASSKYGNAAVGLYLEVYEPNGSSKADKIESGTDVTAVLDKVSKANDVNLVDVFDLNNKPLYKDVIRGNKGLREEGFFVDKSFVMKVSIKLKTDSQYIMGDFDNKVSSIVTPYLQPHNNSLAGRSAARFSNIYTNIGNIFNQYIAKNPDDIFNRQYTFLRQKSYDINTNANAFANPKIIKNGANRVILDIILPTIKNYYIDQFARNSEYSKELKAFRNEAEKQEILDKAEFANISKVNQAAELHDKLMRVRDAQLNGKPLYGDKDGNNLSKDKPKATKQKVKKPEESKEKRLVNLMKTYENAIKSWQRREELARGKDREEAHRHVMSNIEALEKTAKKYEQYIKDHQSPEVSAPIDSNTTDELTFDVNEAYVNDGASSYFRDQQAAAKDALKGTITEEITHSELNPVLFDGEILKSDVLDAFLEIADKFKQTLNISIDPVDVYFTGSNANYNYNENSDIDLHLVYDFEKVGIAAEILEKYLRDAKRLFNLDYDEIKVKGIKVEVGYENLATPLVATAVYSLRNNTWVKKPDMKAAQIQDPDTEAYNDITSRIENAIQDKDLNTLESLWKEIGNLRKQSLNLEGEFGQGNALFKKLRNLGAIGRLRDAYYRAASKELSLESNGANTNE